MACISRPLVTLSSSLPLLLPPLSSSSSSLREDCAGVVIRTGANFTGFLGCCLFAECCSSTVSFQVCVYDKNDHVSPRVGTSNLYAAYKNVDNQEKLSQRLPYDHHSLLSESPIRYLLPIEQTALLFNSRRSSRLGHELASNLYSKYDIQALNLVKLIAS